MTFAASGLTLVQAAGPGAGPNIWRYKSADAHGDVDATDYFAGMGFGTLSGQTTRGMKVDDIVYVQDSNLGTLTMHYVTAVDSEGNATISVATLS